MYAVLSTDVADVDDGSPLYNFCLLEFAVWSIMMSFHRAFLWRPSCGYVLMPWWHWEQTQRNQSPLLSHVRVAKSQLWFTSAIQAHHQVSTPVKVLLELLELPMSLAKGYPWLLRNSQIEEKGVGFQTCLKAGFSYVHTPASVY
jgi:hypothetical protein